MPNKALQRTGARSYAPRSRPLNAYSLAGRRAKPMPAKRKALSSEGSADIIASRSLELVRGRKREDVVVEIYRPVPADNQRDFRCRVKITTPTREFENTVFGIDRMQALVLAVRAVDMKLGRLALATKAELQFLGTPKFAVFTELEGLDRLGNSLVNCLDALQLAQRTLLHPAASDRRRQTVARKISGVLESAGFVGVDGKHVRSDPKGERWFGWSETARRRPRQQTVRARRGKS